MLLHFYKYQGTGNDFVIIDNRNGNALLPTKEKIKQICDRRFGIGADGFMLLNPTNEDALHFEMKYYNADGNEGSMCGNGGRCIVQFASDLGMEMKTFHFIAVDGLHQAEVEGDVVKLKMNDVSTTKKLDTGNWELNTGSPHYIVPVSNIQQIDVNLEGKKIRHSKPYGDAGINVNFVENISPQEIWVRTFERGVEAETYSCGTGVTAAALINAYNIGHNEIVVNTLGGKLNVKFEKESESNFSNIWLCGPAKMVFEGNLEI